MTRIFLKQNVFDAALDRIRLLYDEFPETVVAVSGGKDSTVVLHLTLMVAAERKRLPVNVFWIDQEAEWDCVVRHNRETLARPDVRPFWFQGQFRLPNSTTTNADPWLYCWRDGDAWMREREPDSIHENLCGTEDFYELYKGFLAAYFRGPVAMIGGIRCEESPGRMQSLQTATYKGITWGKTHDKKRCQYTFYPIYDWGYRDVWKAIHDHGWPYCELYDWQYQHGVPLRDMRVSNVNHETALKALTFMQEVEPETWNRLLRRLPSVNAAQQCAELYSPPRVLPPMFGGWREYRDYLLENLITVSETRELIRKHFALWERNYLHELNPEPAFHEKFHKMCIATILTNDYDCWTKYGNFNSKEIRRARGYGRALIEKGAGNEPGSQG